VTATDLEARLRAITEELIPDSEDGRNRAIRQRLARRLLDDPMLYYDELSDAERAYISSQRGFLVRRLADATGTVAEVRAEGLALLDPTGEATDLTMPEEGTDGHATLLLAKHLAEHARAQPGEPVSLVALQTLLAELAQEHRAHWRKGTAEPGAVATLCRLAVHRLEALGLARCDGAGVIPRPGLARFDYAEPAIQGDLGEGASA
jgi:uncharacterized protein (TIGR02678 family)